MNSKFSDELLDRISDCGVVAVLVVDRAELAVPLAKSLLDGGVDAMELTLRTPVALEALEQVRRKVPQMLAGVGTILTAAQVDQVVQAGAAFGVAPGLNPAVVSRAGQRQLPFAPGVVTPSEVERAVELGCRELKFFPAEPSGGLKYLRSMHAPYSHLGLRYIPLGGVNADNLSDYLCDPSVLAVGGSWIAPRETIDRETWPTVTANAAASAAAVKACRKVSEVN